MEMYLGIQEKFSYPCGTARRVKWLLIRLKDCCCGMSDLAADFRINLDGFLNQPLGFSFSQSVDLECGLVISILKNFPNDTDD